MKSLRGIVEKHLKSFNSTTATPGSSQEATTSKPQAPGLLSLPGELRNKIYSFAIFPELDELFIPNCTRPSDIARTILNPSVFRVSQQVRAESLSWLLVNKRLIFFGISSFNALCKTVGPRVKDIQSCRIVVTARFDIVSAYAENLFRNLEAASALARLHLEVGVIAWRAAAEGQTQDGAARREWEFFVRLNEFVKSKGDDFVFKWSMWSFHELGVFMHEQQKAALGELFGMDAESEESQVI